MYEFVKFNFISNVGFCKILNVRALLVFPYFQISFTDVKEISDFLHIQLTDRNFQFELYCLWGLLDFEKQIFYLLKPPITILGMSPLTYLSLMS